MRVNAISFVASHHRPTRDPRLTPILSTARTKAPFFKGSRDRMPCVCVVPFCNKRVNWKGEGCSIPSHREAETADARKKREARNAGNRVPPESRHKADGKKLLRELAQADPTNPTLQRLKANDFCGLEHGQQVQLTSSNEISPQNTLAWDTTISHLCPLSGGYWRRWRSEFVGRSGTSKFLNDPEPARTIQLEHMCTHPALLLLAHHRTHPSSCSRATQDYVELMEGLPPTFSGERFSTARLQQCMDLLLSPTFMRKDMTPTARDGLSKLASIKQVVFVDLEFRNIAEGGRNPASEAMLEYQGIDPKERDEAVHPVYDGRKIFVEASLRKVNLETAETEQSCTWSAMETGLTPEQIKECREVTQALLAERMVMCNYSKGADARFMEHVAEMPYEAFALDACAIMKGASLLWDKFKVPASMDMMRAPDPLGFGLPNQKVWDEGRPEADKALSPEQGKAHRAAFDTWQLAFIVWALRRAWLTRDLPAASGSSSGTMSSTPPRSSASPPPLSSTSLPPRSTALLPAAGEEVEEEAVESDEEDEATLIKAVQAAAKARTALQPLQNMALPPPQSVACPPSQSMAVPPPPPSTAAPSTALPPPQSDTFLPPPPPPSTAGVPQWSTHPTWAQDDGDWMPFKRKKSKLE